MSNEIDWDKTWKNSKLRRHYEDSARRSSERKFSGSLPLSNQMRYLKMIELKRWGDFMPRSGIFILLYLKGETRGIVCWTVQRDGLIYTQRTGFTSPPSSLPGSSDRWCETAAPPDWRAISNQNLASRLAAKGKRLAEKMLKIQSELDKINQTLEKLEEDEEDEEDEARDE